MTVVDRNDPTMGASRSEADERAKRLRGRNLAVLAGLVGLVALFYGITIVRMGAGH